MHKGLAYKECMFFREAIHKKTYNFTNKEIVILENYINFSDIDYNLGFISTEYNIINMEQAKEYIDKTESGNKKRDIIFEHLFKKKYYEPTKFIGNRKILHASKELEIQHKIDDKRYSY